VSDHVSQARSVYVWVREGTWRAAVDAALSLAPPGSRFTVLHVTSEDGPDAARGAYAGLFGRGGRDPATRLAEEAEEAAARLLQAAAERIGQACDQVELQGRTERVVVAASAQADLLIVARDGDQARLGPKSLGRETRFVVDHAACPVLLVWPGAAPEGPLPPEPQHGPQHGRHKPPHGPGPGGGPPPRRME
jgi:nucleotide-binding universal stress UspA family protein